MMANQAKLAVLFTKYLGRFQRASMIFFLNFTEQKWKTLRPCPYFTNFFGEAQFDNMFDNESKFYIQFM